MSYKFAKELNISKKLFIWIGFEIVGLLLLQQRDVGQGVDEQAQGELGPGGGHHRRQQSGGGGEEGGGWGFSSDHVQSASGDHQRNWQSS